MSHGTTLVELLAELGGAELEVRRESSLLAAAVLRMRSGDLWQVWNSDRTQTLEGAV